MKVRVVKSGRNVYVKDLANNTIVCWFFDDKDEITPGIYNFHRDAEPGKIDLVLIDARMKKHDRQREGYLPSENN